MIGGFFDRAPHEIAFHQIAAAVGIVVVDQAPGRVEEDIVDELGFERDRLKIPTLRSIGRSINAAGLASVSLDVVVLRFN